MTVSGRPQSPNLQIYRPQLTSVLSFAHRVSGVFLGFGGLVLVLWLVSAASGPAPYQAVMDIAAGHAGQVLLFAWTLAFFYHLCNGIRHLFWDAGYGFALEQIYRSGWTVVMVSVVLTLVVWIAVMSVNP